MFYLAVSTGEERRKFLPVCRVEIPHWQLTSIGRRGAIHELKNSTYPKGDLAKYAKINVEKSLTSLVKQEISYSSSNCKKVCIPSSSYQELEIQKVKRIIQI